jgi:hypothetical protein
MEKKIKINEIVFASFITFLAYGFFGIANPSQSNLAEQSFIDWCYFISPIVAICIYFLINHKNNLLKLNLAFSFLKIKTYILILTGVLFSYFITQYLGFSLTGDQIYYSAYAFIHSTELLPKLMLLLPSLSNYEFKLLIIFFSFFLILLTFLYLYFLIQLNKFNQFIFLIFLVSSIFIARGILAFLGGNPVVHAPFSSLYILFLSPILGLSDVSIQAGYFLSFVLFGFYIFKKLYLELENVLSAFLVMLFLFSIPAYFFLGSTVEPSIWSTICYSIVLINLTDSKFVRYKYLVYIILIFSFFRISSIFSIVPILTHIVFNKNFKSNLKENIYYLLNIFSPIILFVPFFLFAFTKGSAATSEASFSLMNFVNLFSSGEMLTLYSDTFSIFILFIYLFLVLINFNKSFTYIGIIFFLFLSVFFFSINESLWSFAKYRIEIFMPLLISQTIYFFRNFKSKDLYIKTFIFILTLSSLNNIKTIFYFPESCSKNLGYISNQNMTYNMEHGCNVLSRIPYDFYQAIAFIKAEDKLSKTYFPGVYYGVFIHIINGVTLDNFILAESIWTSQQDAVVRVTGGNFSGIPSEINADKRIEFVVLGFTQDIEFIRSSLATYGWSEALYYKNDYGLPVYVMQRN